MNVPLLAHVNRDDDLVEAWLRHYVVLGVSSFHLILHGGREQNRTVVALAHRYPIVVIDEYDGPFDVFVKRERLTWGLARLRSGWVVLVDSDEFLELPFRSLSRTIAMMRWLRSDSLSAPMLQRFTTGGALSTSAGNCPFETYPWCSTDLYARLGQPNAVIDKYPLFKVGSRTALRSGGNHYPPNGYGSRIAPMTGVTHHFKWRAAVGERLRERAFSSHPYRGESVQYLNYLDSTAWQLPTTGAFRYSRGELFRRRLLTRPRVADIVRRRADLAEVHGGKDRVFNYMTSPHGIAARVKAGGHTAVALCGAGSGAQMCLAALRRYGVTVTHIADRDPRRWGSSVEGVPVSGLDDVLRDGARVFVAASLTYGPEMATQIRERAAASDTDVTVFVPGVVETPA